MNLFKRKPKPDPLSLALGNAAKGKYLTNWPPSGNPYYPEGGITPPPSLPWWPRKRKPSDNIDPYEAFKERNDFKIVKSKKGMAIAEFKPITIYKCPICGKEVECGEKVFILSKGARFNPKEENVVVCHLGCAKRLPNIIVELFNAAIAEKV